ncbi:MAG: ComEC/Rec2 family competence protein [Verrucomicrobiota bacterium]
MDGLKTGFSGFCGRHPLFVAALVAAACVFIAWKSLPAVCLFAIVLPVLGGRLLGWRTAVAWCVCGGLAIAVFTARTGRQRTDEQVLLAASSGDLQGRLVADAVGSTRFWSATVRLATGPRPGALVRWQGRGSLPIAGSWVRAHGDFLPLPEPRNPGDFDQAKWLRSLGVAAVFDASRVQGRVMTGTWAQRGAAMRQGFRVAVTDGLPEDSRAAQVIRAVVIGEKPPDAEALVAAFRNSGTLHAFSVSGLHVSMVGALCWFFLRHVGVSRRLAVALLLPLIFGYAWITGNTPPATRSAWMAAVFLMAFVLRRKPDLLNSLGAVLLVAALWDGRLLFLPGMQLSYGVVAAIAVGIGMASRLFAWIAKPELYLPLAEMNRAQRVSLTLRQKIAGLLSVSLAAGIGSTPLTIFHFGLVTPISVLAGVVVVPIVGALLGLALVSAALHPFVPAASRAVNRGNGLLAQFCTFAADGFARIPGGHFQMRQDSQPFLLVYDLRHGDGAVCFSGGNGAAVLIDAGGAYGFQRRVAPSLQRLGIAPDSLVFTHPDGGHLGGGAAVWQALPIRQALLPVEKSRSPAFRAWLTDAPRAGVRTMLAVAGRSLSLPDGASLEILHTPDPAAVNALADDRVMISRLHWRGWKILLTSDAGVGTELEMLAAGRDLSADILIAGRNEAGESLSDAFLDAVQPQLIVASHADFPAAQSLDPRSVGHWKSRGIQVIHQGQSGGVTMSVDDAGKLHLLGFADGSEVILPRR